MSAGRKPKPTALQLIQGTYRADRAKLAEPKLRGVIPPCPEFLHEQARKQYQQTAKKLARIGLMTELDDMALTILCQSWGECLDAWARLQETGMLVKFPNGYPMTNPYWAVLNQAVKKLSAMLSEFGLTPGSRSRIHALAAGEDSDDEWSKLLKQPSLKKRTTS
jgi:P27 family predicted phage terminase small subunit